MSATVAQLRAVISIDDRPFQQGIQRSQRGMQELAGAAKRTGEAVKRDLGEVLDAFGNRDALKAMSNAFTSLGSVAGSALKGVLGLFGQFGSVVANVAGQISGTLMNALSGALQTATALAATLGGVLGAALVAVGKAGLDFNATMAQGRIGLTAVLGSAQAAAGGMERFKKMADDSLLSLQDVTGQGTQLARAFGKDGWSQVLPSMKAFDAAAKVNQVSLQNVQNAMLQFRQLIQRDFAQQEELNGIGENLQINVAGYLRKAFGSADTEALKQANVSAKAVAKALVDGINAELGPQAAAMGRSLPIVLSGFGDTFAKIAGKATEAFGPRLTAALDGILTQFGRLADNGQLLRALEVPFTLVAKAIEAVGGVLPGVVDWLGKVATQQNVVNLLSQVAGWVKTLGEEVGRFISAATGGKALGDVFTTFQGIAEKAIDGVLRGWNVLVSSIRFLSDHAGEIWQVFADAMQPAQKALDALIGAVTVLAGMAAGGKLLEFFGKFQINPGGGGPAMAGMFPGMPGGGTQGGLGPVDPSRKGPWRSDKDGVSYLTREEAQRAGIKVLRPGEIKPDWNQFKQTALSPQMIVGPQAADQLPGNIFNSLSGVGAKVREEITRGVTDAAGKLPGRVKGLWGGFQSQAQTAWNEGGLDAFRKRQEENARKIQQQLNRALGPSASVAGSGIAPGHVMSQRGGAAVADAMAPTLSDGKAEKKAEKEAAKLLGARQAAYDALLSQARAMAEMAGEGEKAQTEARIVVPALAAKLEELSRQAQQLLPKARTSADAAKDYWDTVKQGWAVQGQMNDLQQRAQQEQENALKKAQAQAKEAAEKARKAVADRLKGADLVVQLREAQLKNIPGLSDRQRQQALVPSMLQKYFAQNQAAAGSQGNDRLEQLLGATQTRSQILESAGIMKDGRLRVGLKQARLAFAQLDQIAAQAAQAVPTAPAMPQMAHHATQMAAAQSPYGPNGTRVTNNQITLTFQGEMTERKWWELFQEFRRRESRESGLIGPAGGFYR